MNKDLFFKPDKFPTAPHLPGSYILIILHRKTSHGRRINKAG